MPGGPDREQAMIYNIRNGKALRLWADEFYPVDSG
jgi:hypothetical protein